MSFSKKGRNVQSTYGKEFPDGAIAGVSGQAYADILSDALKRQFTGTPCVLKSIARVTGANERSVKNWWTGQNGPSGEHLITLARHSDEVLGAILALAGRQEILANKKVSDIRRLLGSCFTELDELMAPDELEMNLNWVELDYFLPQGLEYPAI
jgi:hypothetical protein